jgi:hypothetical protein
MRRFNMASIVIKAVTTQTRGGFDATITSIDPTNTDCLEGTVKTPAAGLREVRWNLGGICRDNHEDLNLDMRNNETHNLRATAERIGATF